MQAVGMVNDHVVGCFRHDDVVVPDLREQGPACAGRAGGIGHGAPISSLDCASNAVRGPMRAMRLITSR